MKVVALKRQNEVLINSCGIARDFMSRFMGLMGKSTLSSDEALCFPNCNSIHTFFMKIPIDVLFVSKEGKVIEILESLAPWKMLLPRRGVKHTVEMKSGLARALGITVGDELQIDGVWN